MVTYFKKFRRMNNKMVYAHQIVVTCVGSTLKGNYLHHSPVGKFFTYAYQNNYVSKLKTYPHFRCLVMDSIKDSKARILTESMLYKSVSCKINLEQLKSQKFKLGFQVYYSFKISIKLLRKLN